MKHLHMFHLAGMLSETYVNGKALKVPKKLHDKIENNIISKPIYGQSCIKASFLSFITSLPDNLLKTNKNQNIPLI